MAQPLATLPFGVATVQLGSVSSELLGSKLTPDQIPIKNSPNFILSPPTRPSSSCSPMLTACRSTCRQSTDASIEHIQYRSAT
ncbi:hypothetical protein F4680DRAFT_440629 [Xylaria scruposa]|nr:hypothetical protein F4680DRAFT_440629 [Xylaria scruposa]